MIGRGERHEKKRKRKEEQGINRETGRTKKRTPWPQRTDHFKN